MKDVGSQCMILCIIYMGLIKFMNHILHIYAFETLSYTLSYVKEKLKIYSFVKKTGQNTTYGFVFKDTHVAYLNLNFQ